MTARMLARMGGGPLHLIRFHVSGTYAQGSPLNLDGLDNDRITIETLQVSKCHTCDDCTTSHHVTRMHMK